MGMAMKNSSRSQPADPAGKPDRPETAGYIALMTSELRALALNAELPFLAHLLAMAEDEARTVAGS